MANRRIALKSSWAQVNLKPALEGKRAGNKPRLLARADGHHLLYPRKVHLASGEPESGKGWFALAAARDCIQRGRKVLYIDFETEAVEIVERLESLDLSAKSIEDQFLYIRPDNGLHDAADWRALRDCLRQKPRLVVIDGLTEALTLQNLNLNDNADVAQWFTKLPRTVARKGPAVLLIDHVVKDPEARNRFSIGAQHKLAASDVAFGLKVRKTLGRNRVGSVRITVTKDRSGYLRELGVKKFGGVDVLAEMLVNSGSDGAVTIRLVVPETSQGDLTELMERLSRAIGENPGIGARALREMGAKAAAVDDAVKRLIAEGYVEVRLGARNKHEHFPSKPFRAEGET